MDNEGKKIYIHHDPQYTNQNYATIKGKRDVKCLVSGHYDKTTQVVIVIVVNSDAAEP